GPETGTTGSQAAVLGLVEQCRGISVHQGKNIVTAGDEFGLMFTQQSVGPGRGGRVDGSRESCHLAGQFESVPGGVECTAPPPGLDDDAYLRRGGDER